MRKKPILFIGTAVAIVMLASWAFAGDYHTGTDLICNECHVMHGEQSHGYNDNGGGLWTAIGASGPYDFLLRNEINALCLTCHDGINTIPDVLMTSANVSMTNRQAGALNMGNVAPYEDGNGHTLGTLAVAPGGAFADSTHGLNCVNCHTAHGANAAGVNSYRNLGGYGTAAFGNHVTYTTAAVPDLTVDVAEDSDTGNSMAHYGVTGIAFQEPDPLGSAYATFCKSCHTDFHGDVPGTEMGGVAYSPAGFTDFIRHPTNTVNIGEVGGGHSGLGFPFLTKTYQVQVMDPDGEKPGNWDAGDTDLDLPPSIGPLRVTELG